MAQPLTAVPSEAIGAGDAGAAGTWKWVSSSQRGTIRPPAMISRSGQTQPDLPYHPGHDGHHGVGGRCRTGYFSTRLSLG